jgi:hypothetical protein
MTFKKIQILALASLFISGCIKIEKVSDIPEIIYSYHTSAYCEDQLGNQNKCVSLYFQLQDGNGDIGLSESDTLPPFTGVHSHNFYYDVLIPQGDNFVSWPDLSINFFNLPYIEPDGQNKVLIADVKVDMSFPVSSLNYDTIIISFYVYDRALNQSNIEITNKIIFSPPNN